MAKGLSHFFEFNSRGGKGFASKKYRVEFWVEGFVGTPEELVGGSSPLVQSWNKDMSSGGLGSIVNSVLSIQAVSTTNFYASHFLSETYGDVVVKVARWNGLAFETTFRAILTPFESNDLDRATGLYTVSLSAECGLAYLKGVPYIPPSGSEGKKRLIEILKTCLEKIPQVPSSGLLDEPNFKIYDQTSLFRDAGRFIDEPRNWGYWGTFISEQNFEGMTCWEVIEAIKQPYTDIFQSEGSWVIRNISDFSNDTFVGEELRISWDLFNTSRFTIDRSTSPIQRIAGGFFGHIFTDKKITVNKSASRPRDMFGEGEFNDLEGWTFINNTPEDITLPFWESNPQALDEGPRVGNLGDSFYLENGYLLNKSISGDYKSNSATDAWDFVNDKASVGYDTVYQNVNNLYDVAYWNNIANFFLRTRTYDARLVSPPLFWNPYKRMTPDEDGDYLPSDGLRVAIRGVFGSELTELAVAIAVTGPMQDGKPFTSYLMENGTWQTRDMRAPEHPELDPALHNINLVSVPMRVPISENIEDDIIYIDVPIPPTPTQDKKIPFFKRLFSSRKNELNWTRKEGLFYDNPNTNKDNLLAYSPVYELRVVIFQPHSPTVIYKDNEALTFSTNIPTLPSKFVVTEESKRMRIDYVRVYSNSSQKELSDGFSKEFVPLNNQISARNSNTEIDLKVGFPSDTGADALYGQDTDNPELIIRKFSSAGRYENTQALPIENHLASNFLSVLSNYRLKTYEGQVLGDLYPTSLVGISGVKYRFQNLEKDYRRNSNTIKVIQNEFEFTEITESTYLSIYDEGRITTTPSAGGGVKILSQNASFSPGSGYGPTSGGVYTLSDDPVYSSVASQSVGLLSSGEGTGFVMDISEETDEEWTLIKPAENGTYATREWTELGFVKLLPEDDMSTTQTGNIHINGRFLIGENESPEGVGELTSNILTLGGIRSGNGTSGILLKSGPEDYAQIYRSAGEIQFLNIVNSGSGGVLINNRVRASSSYVLINTANRLKSADLEIGGSIAFQAISSGELSYIYGEGDSGQVRKSAPSSLSLKIADSSNSVQFTSGIGENIRFEGAGDTSISFNSATKSIIITSIAGSGGGTIGLTSFNGRTASAVVPQSGDYTTAMVAESGSLYFTQARALETPLTGFTLGSSSAITSSDTILSAFGKVAFGLQSIIPSSRSISVLGAAGRIVSTAGSQDLSADRAWTLDLATTGVGAGTYTRVAIDVYGRVVGASFLSTSDIPDLPASKITSGVFNTARLGSGAASASSYLAGDGSWKTLPALSSALITLSAGTGLSGGGVFNLNQSFPSTISFALNANLEQLSNVSITSIEDGQILVYDTDSSSWKNSLVSSLEDDPVFRASTAFGITPTNVSNWNVAHDKAHNSVSFSGLNYLTFNAATQSLVAGLINISSHTTGVVSYLQGGTGLNTLGTAGQVLRVNSAGTGFEYFTLPVGNLGTVTSVGLAAPNIFTVSGSPVTDSGTLTLALATQAAGLVFASGTSGAVVPSFRALVATDIPNLPTTKITSGVFPVARLGTGTPAAGMYLSGTGAWAELPTVPSQTLSFSTTTGDLSISSGNSISLDGRYALLSHTHALLTRGTGLAGANYNGASATTWSFDSVWGDARYALKAELVSQTISWNSTTGSLAISNGNSISLDGRYSLLSHVHTLASLSDVTITSPSNGQILRRVTAGWENWTPDFLTSTSLSSYYTKVESDARFAPISHSHALLTRGAGLVGSNYNGSAATTWAFDTVFGDARYALKGDVTAQTLSFTSANGNLSISGGNTVNLDGRYLQANQSITLSGAVTGSGSTSIVTTLSDNIVTTSKVLNSNITLAKVQNVATQTLLGRYATGSGVLQSITLGSGLSLNSSGVLSVVGGSSGTVTSVGLSMPFSVFTVTNSPVTSSGTINVAFASQSARSVFSGPTGASGSPTFRLLTTEDISDGVFSSARLGSGTASASTFLRGDGSWSTLPAPTISVSPNQFLYGSASGTITSSPYIIIDSSSNRYIRFLGDGSNYATLGVNPSSGSTAFRIFTGTSTNILLESGADVIVGPLRSTVGSSARMVTVDSNGVLGSAAIPSGGTGTVTSVSLSAPSIFTVSSGAITTSGTLTFALNTQNGRTFLAGPNSSGIAVPTFRSLSVDDIPSLSADKITSGTINTARLGAGTASDTTYLRGDGQWVAISAGSGGTVTSVGLSAPSIFAVSSSPVTTSGTIGLSLNSQAQNLVFAGPTTGSNTPSFRALVAGDIPSLDATKITTGIIATARLGAGAANNTLFLRGDGAWAAVPTTSLTLPADYIGFGTGSGVTSSSNLRFVSGSFLRIFGGGTPYMGMGFVSGTAVLEAKTAHLNIYTDAGYSTTITSLAGTGTRMVTATASGQLSTQAIPTGGTGTVTSVGFVATSGSGIELSGNTTITTSGTLYIGLINGSVPLGKLAYTPQNTIMGRYSSGIGSWESAALSSNFYFSGGSLQLSLSNASVGANSILYGNSLGGLSWSSNFRYTGQYFQMQNGAAYVSMGLPSASAGFAIQGYNSGITLYTEGAYGVTIANLAGSGNRMVITDPSGRLYAQAIPGGGGGGTVTSVTGTSSFSIANSTTTPYISLNAGGVFLTHIQSIASGTILGRSAAGNGTIETLNIGSGLSLSGGVLSATGGGGSVSLPSTQIGYGTGSGITSSSRLRFVDGAYLQVFGTGTAYIGFGVVGTTATLESGSANLNLYTYPGYSVTLNSLAGSGNRMVVANPAGTLSTQAIPSGGGGVSLPAGQIGYGTGSGITSSPNFTVSLAGGARYMRLMSDSVDATLEMSTGFGSTGLGYMYSANSAGFEIGSIGHSSHMNKIIFAGLTSRSLSIRLAAVDIPASLAVGTLVRFRVMASSSTNVVLQLTTS